MQDQDVYVEKEYEEILSRNSLIDLNSVSHTTH